MLPCWIWLHISWVTHRAASHGWMNGTVCRCNVFAALLRLSVCVSWPQRPSPREFAAHFGWQAGLHRLWDDGRDRQLYTQASMPGTPRSLHRMLAHLCPVCPLVSSAYLSMSAHPSPHPSARLSVCLSFHAPPPPHGLPVTADSSKATTRGGLSSLNGPAFAWARASRSVCLTFQGPHPRHAVCLSFQGPHPRHAAPGEPRVRGARGRLHHAGPVAPWV
jgi:hypothetical protein